MTAFAEWDSFYLIVAAAAGALIGLQFVVMTLIADRPTSGNAEASAAFGTPTIMHFSAVLFLSAWLRAPWHGIGVPTFGCGILGVAGFGYALLVIRRMMSQTAYEAVLEDWVFHAGLPLLAYGALAAGGFVAHAQARPGLFAIGGGALLLLFIGIHNAWDSVAYHVLVVRPKQKKEE
ncbi:MAG TPA: hypothetical protein VGL42_05760 [Opitutaceae bacterium]|jgi:hypothetical protein